MSQIQSFGIAGMPPSGPILTLTGDIGPAVLPTLNNINIIGIEDPTVSKFVVVDGTSALSTLNIFAAFDTIQTNNEVPVVFANAVYDLDPLTSVVITANVIGSKDDYTAACGGLVTAVGRRDALNPSVLVGQSPLLSRDSTTGLPIFGIILDGNSVKVGVAGVLGEIWNWTCTYQYQKQVEV